MVLNYLKQQTIEYKGEEKTAGNTRVQTNIMRANEHIPVDYAVVLKDGRWLVRDVTIDGVSIVGNYQNQFRRVIQAQSFDELLKKMRVQSKAIRDNPLYSLRRQIPVAMSPPKHAPASTSAGKCTPT
jgi:ABC-type transporter MlaC component